MGDPVPSSAISDATVGGLSVIVITGGSTGDVLTKQSDGTYAPAAASGSYLPLAGGTLTGQFIVSVNGAASTPPVKVSGTWYTGGSGTTTKPQVLIEPSSATSTAWSTSGTGFGINAASGFTGNLIDVQLNGTSLWKMNYTGQITATNDHFFGSGVVLSWSTRFQMRSIAADQMRMTDANATKGYVLSSATDGTMAVLDKTGSAAGNVTCGALTASALLCAGVYTAGTLPSASANAYKFASVSDSSVTTFGSTVAGGGSSKVMVYSNGTNWTVAAA